MKMNGLKFLLIGLAILPTAFAQALKCGSEVGMNEKGSASSAALIVWKKDGSIRTCSASILDQRQILTTASCVQAFDHGVVIFASDVSTELIKIQQGTTLTKESFLTKYPSQEIPKNIHFHHDYNVAVPNIQNDLAVLDLNADIPLSFKKIELVADQADLNTLLLNSINKSVTALGFGGINQSAGVLKNQLLNFESVSTINQELILVPNKIDASCLAGAEIGDAGGSVLLFKDETPATNLIQIGVMVGSELNGNTNTALVTKKMIDEKILQPKVAEQETPITYSLIKTNFAVCLNCHKSMFKDIQTTQKKLAGMVTEVNAGDMPPPKSGLPPLNSCQKALLQKWFDLGAPETSTTTLESLPECKKP